MTQKLLARPEKKLWKAKWFVIKSWSFEISNLSNNFPGGQNHTVALRVFELRRFENQRQREKNDKGFYLYTRDQSNFPTHDRTQ